MTDEPPRYGFGHRGPRPGWKPGTAGQTYTPTLLQPEDVEALLRVSGGGGAGLRGRAAIGVLYRTGMAPGEALALKLTDLRLEPDSEARVWVSGSTRLADRWLALDAPALALLRPWLDWREDWPCEHLFCITDGPDAGRKPWPEGGLRGFLERRAERAGLDVPGTERDKRVHPWAFRFSLAADLMVEQWPIPYIQAVLGTKTFESFGNVMKHLELGQPDAEDVLPLIRDHRPEWVPPPVTRVPQR